MKRARLSVHADPMGAQVVRALLLDAGLHPLPAQVSADETLPGSGDGHFVYVPEAEYETAVEILKETPSAKYLW